MLNQAADWVNHERTRNSKRGKCDEHKPQNLKVAVISEKGRASKHHEKRRERDTSQTTTPTGEEDKQTSQKEKRKRVKERNKEGEFTTKGAANLQGKGVTRGKGDEEVTATRKWFGKPCQVRGGSKGQRENERDTRKRKG